MRVVAVAVGLAIALPAPVLAGALAGEPRVTLAIPAGPLRQAVLAMGAQASVSIGMTDPALSGVIVRGVRGRMPVADALTRMLAGTTATFERIDARTYRIVRRPIAARRPSGRIAIADPPPATTGPDIVVTGSKRRTLLDDYPGSVIQVDVASLRPGTLLHGSEALVARQPILSSTHLGPGRDKLFIRGVADSSFSGPTQATVGQYLGDVRLNYNAPDPDLALYDVASVEVLEGPQGTLYGAGSIGGIVRIEPVAPDLSRIAASSDGGVSTTAHGAAGGDAAALVNLPIVGDRLGLRGVGYAGIDGGYIADARRGLRDINRTRTTGGRVNLRYRPSDDWTVDLGVVRQDIVSRDGQYAETGLPPLTRASGIAQPFDNDYTLGSLAIRHRMGAMTLSSATSVVRHALTTTYDASMGPAVPIAYRERERITLLSNETRLSHPPGTNGAGVNGAGGWVIGLQLLRSDDRLARDLGPPGKPAPLVGTRNVVEEGSLFGEGTLALTPKLAATGGGRLVYDRLVDEARDLPSPQEPRRTELSVLPSVGLLWAVRPSLKLYARYQEGYRAGGLSTDGAVTQLYRSDTVATSELGARYRGLGDTLSASAAISFAHWEDIQADLVGADGLPFIANIGTGRIIGFEARVAWRPARALTIEGGLFANDSTLEQPAAGFTGERRPSLPNIADIVTGGSLRYAPDIAGRRVSLSGSVQYVGRSRLGVGTTLDLGQGGYVDTRLGLGVPIDRRVTLSADLTNLLDHRDNIFALGNPFGVADGRQVTPQRPRTLRIGLSAAF